MSVKVKLPIKMRTAQKLVVTFILSSACILIYQYQLSRAPLISQDATNANAAEEEVVHFKLLVAQQPNTTTTTTSTPSPPAITYLTYNNRSFTNRNATDKKSSSEAEPGLRVSPNQCACDPGITQGHLPPPLYVITPTYRRPQMLAELTRLGYTLKHVPNLYWLVVEDSLAPTPLVTDLLKKFNVPFEHLAAQMPEKYRKVKVKPRGVANRMRALDWIRANASDGVFYFADDDNTYDVDIFNEMRFTKKVSMWPVGLIDKYGVSSPIVRNGTVVDFYEFWKGGRKFPVDMAGFAVNVRFFMSRPNATMPYKAGYEEDGFLKSLKPLAIHDIEPLAENCTKVYVWHTQTRHYASPANPDKKKYKDTNIIKLREMLL